MNFKHYKILFTNEQNLEKNCENGDDKMERIVILNGSPRAPKSNSKCYADIFSKKYNKDIEYYNITKQKSMINYSSKMK